MSNQTKDTIYPMTKGDKFGVQSFLDGFDFLSEDDLDILATFEEEQARRAQSHFNLIFPTKETIDTLGPYFDC